MFRSIYLLTVVLLIGVPGEGSFAQIESDYFRHFFFDNNLTNDTYFYSYAADAEPSKLVFKDFKTLVDTTYFLLPLTSLRCSWISNPGGTWEFTVKWQNWRNREALFAGDTLCFWLYTPDGIASGALPGIKLTDQQGKSSEVVALQAWSGDIPADTWTSIKIPLSTLDVRGALFYPLLFNRV